jgi:hypothetical protein
MALTLSPSAAGKPNQVEKPLFSPRTENVLHGGRPRDFRSWADGIYLPSRTPTNAIIPVSACLSSFPWADSPPKCPNSRYNDGRRCRTPTIRLPPGKKTPIDVAAIGMLSGPECQGGDQGLFPQSQNPFVPRPGRGCGHGSSRVQRFLSPYTLSCRTLQAEKKAVGRSRRKNRRIHLHPLILTRFCRARFR